MDVYGLSFYDESEVIILRIVEVRREAIESYLSGFAELIDVKCLLKVIVTP